MLSFLTFEAGDKMEVDAASNNARVEEILRHAEETNKRLKSVEVVKEAEPEFDLGNLLLNDQQPLDLPQLKSNENAFLHSLARDNTQLLINEIWKLPVERLEDVILAKLPAPKTVIPREKRIPKPKPPTKWEVFAKSKGIQKKKRERMVWDEEAKDWKPRYGYKRTADVEDKWLIELPDQADSKEDQFEKLNKDKKERIAKNELQRLRNIARNKKGGSKIISSELKPEPRKTQERLKKEIDIAKTSTASIGKFQEKLPKEKSKPGKGVKRKFESLVGNNVTEKRKVLDIWEKVNKPDILDSNKATNRLIADSQKSGESRKSGGKRGTGSRVKNRVIKPKKMKQHKTDAKSRGKRTTNQRKKGK